MLITRSLFLGALFALAACNTPTAPSQSVTSIPQPTTGLPVGHSQPFGTCGSTSITNELCAARK